MYTSTRRRARRTHTYAYKHMGTITNLWRLTLIRYTDEGRYTDDSLQTCRHTDESRCEGTHIQGLSLPRSFSVIFTHIIIHMIVLPCRQIHQNIPPQQVLQKPSPVTSPITVPLITIVTVVHSKLIMPVVMTISAAACMYVCMYVCIRVYMFRCACLAAGTIFLCMYVCVYVCMCWVQLLQLICLRAIHTYIQI